MIDSNLLQLDKILTLAISCFALTISILSYISGKTIQKEQMKEILKHRLPNLQILSIESTKSNPNNPSLIDGSNCRILEGHSTANVSLNRTIATFNSSDSNIEAGFIDEIKTHIKSGCNDTYLTYFFEKPYLIVNHASKKDRFIVDHSNVKITFHNYGASISALSIEEFKVYFKPEMDIEILTFKGNPDCKMKFAPDYNEKFELYFDEVTTDLNNAMCQLPLDVYESVPKKHNILKSHMINNILSYDKLEIAMVCWDIYNTPIKCLITVEYNGNFFISTTTLLEKSLK